MAPVESYLRIIGIFDSEKVLSKEIKHLAEEDEEVKLLMSIPGVGYYSKLCLLRVRLVGWVVFRLLRSFSYAGLVPSRYASGGVVSHGRITKEGSKWLRWVVMEFAQIHVNKYDSSISRAYRCIAGRCREKVARLAAARRLLVCCFSVLKNKRPYYDQTV